MSRLIPAVTTLHPPDLEGERGLDERGVVATGRQWSAQGRPLGLKRNSASPPPIPASGPVPPDRQPRLRTVAQSASNTRSTPSRRGRSGGAPPLDAWAHRDLVADAFRRIPRAPADRGTYALPVPRRLECLLGDDDPTRRRLVAQPRADVGRVAHEVVLSMGARPERAATMSPACNPMPYSTGGRSCSARRAFSAGWASSIQGTRQRGRGR